MKKISIIVLALTALALSPVSAQENTLRKEVKVELFKNLLISGDFDIILKQGDVPSVEIEATETSLNNITLEVHNKMLVAMVMGENPQNVSARLYVTIRELKRMRLIGEVGLMTPSSMDVNNLEIEMVGNSRATMKLNAASLKVTLEGHPELKLFGKAGDVMLNMIGSSVLLADELKCRAITVNASESGQATLNATELLNLTLEGNSTVRYLGDPRIVNNVNGSGKVIKIEK